MPHTPPQTPGLDSTPKALRHSIPGIAWVASRCLQAPPHPLACHHCSAACPAGALLFHEGTLQASEACHGCAQCVAACPTEALIHVEGVQLFHAQPEGEPPRLGCHRVRSEAGMQRLHCLRALGPDQLAWLTARAMPGRAELHLPNACQGCLAGPQPPHDEWLEQASRLCSVTTTSAVADYQSPSYHVSRRALLTGRAAPSLPVIDEHDSAPKARRLQRRVAASHTLAEPYPLPGLSLDPDACRGHGVCARVCPTPALQATSAGELIFNAMECLGCGHCLAACPEGALKAEEVGQPAPVMLRQVEQADCFACGRPFMPKAHTTDDEICPACHREQALMQESFQEPFG